MLRASARCRTVITERRRYIAAMQPRLSGIVTPARFPVAPAAYQVTAAGRVYAHGYIGCWRCIAY
ncbi:hypothetical protein, partial [Hyphomicrobium sp. D-2]|uniref:hypothetical protein n=1 Tax=Hyphomicrobium sp. D-2 TaxID=3041621 RepID=UPI00245745BA